LNNRYYPYGDSVHRNDKNRFYPEWYHPEGLDSPKTTVTNFHDAKSSAIKTISNNMTSVKKDFFISNSANIVSAKISSKKAISGDGTAGLVHSVEEYLAAINDCYSQLWKAESDSALPLKYNSKLWFRGLKSEDYSLIPSIARDSYNVEYETIFISKFKSKALPYLSEPSSFPFASAVESYWGLLFLMQHYGIPTRLMDWSEDALVALLFATDTFTTEAEAAKNAEVWCLNPVKLNQAYKFHEFYPPGYIPNANEPKVYQLFGPQEDLSKNTKPCALYGSLNSTRIMAQKGVFTVFPYNANLTAFEKLPDSATYLSKIVIAGDLRSDITEQLRRYGLTRAQLIPNLASVATEITQEGFYSNPVK
jgi:hypothetical protein